MQVFSVWIDDCGTIKLVSQPTSAARPAAVIVFDSAFEFGGGRATGTRRAPTVCWFDLVSTAPNWAEISEQELLEYGFICVGERVLQITEFEVDLPVAGARFVADIDRIAFGQGDRFLPELVTGSGEVTVLQTLIRALRSFDSVRFPLPAITLFEQPAVPLRYAF